MKHTRVIWPTWVCMVKSESRKTPRSLTDVQAQMGTGDYDGGLWNKWLPICLNWVVGDSISSIGRRRQRTPRPACKALRRCWHHRDHKPACRQHRSAIAAHGWWWFLKGPQYMLRRGLDREPIPEEHRRLTKPSTKLCHQSWSDLVRWVQVHRSQRKIAISGKVCRGPRCQMLPINLAGREVSLPCLENVWEDYSCFCLMILTVGWLVNVIEMYYRDVLWI